VWFLILTIKIGLSRASAAERHRKVAAFSLAGLD
jgi:hypothetical protein